MVAHCSAKAAITLGGAMWVQTDEALSQDTMKSTITWQLKFAVTLVYQSPRNSSPAVKPGARLVCTAWCQSPGYDLRRTRRDLPDLTRNAAHGGINQRFLREERGVHSISLELAQHVIHQFSGRTNGISKRE